MSEDESEQDQSMEEILQSIKRIIADDEPEGEDGEQNVEMQDDDAAESVLELTDVVDDVMSTDDDIVLPEPDVTPEPKPEPEPVFEPTPTVPAPSPAPAPAADSVKPVADQAADVDLVSDVVAQASADALSSLLDDKEEPAIAAIKVESAAFRSGATVEDLVVEALKPMLGEWLNTNLQVIVERIVEKEVKRISSK